MAIVSFMSEMAFFFFFFNSDKCLHALLLLCVSECNEVRC